jgi:parallel beta-helix repeat protein
MVKTVLKTAAATDPGLLRQNNEDGFHSDPDRGIFLVVDGIGGQAAGEKAAEIAIARIRARLERQTGNIEQRAREAVAVANNEIYQAAQAHPDWTGMACVLTLVVLENGSVVVAHVGDSRLYKIRRGTITKITHDHSPVGQREDAGDLNELEAMRHPRRNEVFRDVGSEPHEPDDAGFIEMLRVPFEPDSALLLCSDGLSDQVASKDIRVAVEHHAGDPQAAVHELIDAANLAGGKDNVTVVLVEGEQFQQPAAIDSPLTSHWWSSRPAVFLYGLVLAAAASWLSRPYWLPSPALDTSAITPHVLAVGPGEAFATIQDALAQAHAGDVIEVAGGEYREEVKLKSNVTVRSRVPREAVLRAPATGSGPAVTAEQVKGARMAGFRIAADAQLPLAQGIVLTNSEVELDDMEVAGTGVGIEIRGMASPTLIGNAIHDCTAEGILISGPSKPWLSHNSLSRNGHAGVAAHDGAEPSLVGNVFEKNPVDLPPQTRMESVREMNFFLDTKPRPGTTRTAPRTGQKQ